MCHKPKITSKTQYKQANKKIIFVEMIVKYYTLKIFGIYLEINKIYYNSIYLSNIVLLM